MTTRSKKSLGSTGLIVLALLFLAVTVLSNSLFRGIRLDLTENNLYTISDGTSNILDNIEEPVNLYFFYSDKASENIPAPAASLAIGVLNMSQFFPRSAE